MCDRLPLLWVIKNVSYVYWFKAIWYYAHKWHFSCHLRTGFNIVILLFHDGLMVWGCSKCWRPIWYRWWAFKIFSTCLSACHSCLWACRISDLISVLASMNYHTLCTLSLQVCKLHTFHCVATSFNLVWLLHGFIYMCVAWYPFVKQKVQSKCSYLN